jgi:hypothetical protein
VGGWFAFPPPVAPRRVAARGGDARGEPPGDVPVDRLPRALLGLERRAVGDLVGRLTTELVALRAQVAPEGAAPSSELDLTAVERRAAAVTRRALDAADESVRHHVAFLRELEDERTRALDTVGRAVAAAREAQEHELGAELASARRAAEQLLADARREATEIDRAAHGEVERRLEWTRARAGRLLTRAHALAADALERAGEPPAAARVTVRALSARVLAELVGTSGASETAGALPDGRRATNAFATREPVRPPWWYEEP